MTEAVRAGPGERTADRRGYRSGYYSRGLVTRIGKLELRVPRDREGRFSTELFDRFQRSEKALVSALAEMYVQGVSTRKVKTVTEELCGHTFSASTVSRINKSLDGLLRRFAQRRDGSSARRPSMRRWSRRVGMIASCGSNGARLLAPPGDLTRRSPARRTRRR